jgi:ubiquitin C-terminal hydrolase
LQKSKLKLQIYKPPHYLIFLLKRYDFKKNYGNTFYGEKNNNFVLYPIKDFDIREYIVGPEKNKAIYDLYGVIEHYGSMNQGHYTAICKNNNKWINYNDSSLEIAKNPISKNAYVLFYKMHNDGEGK